MRNTRHLQRTSGEKKSRVGALVDEDTREVINTTDAKIRKLEREQKKLAESIREDMFEKLDGVVKVELARPVAFP